MSLKLAKAKSERNQEEKIELDLDYYIGYLEYYIEHLGELIFDVTNPRQSYDMLSILFAEKPSPQDLVNRTAKLHDVFRLKTQKTSALSLGESPECDPTGSPSCIPDVSLTAYPAVLKSGYFGGQANPKVSSSIHEITTTNPYLKGFVVVTPPGVEPGLPP